MLISGKGWGTPLSNIISQISIVHVAMTNRNHQNYSLQMFSTSTAHLRNTTSFKIQNLESFHIKSDQL